MSPETRNSAQGPSGPQPGSVRMNGEVLSPERSYPRVAVVGVIRGGTSMTVGLLRILGWTIPADHLPSCPPGEARALRIHNNGRLNTVDEVADQVNRLGDGVVWKDPAIGSLDAYVSKINWDRWKIIRVHRSYSDVAASMDRWAEQDAEPRDVLARRAIDWNQRLDNTLPTPTWEMDMDDIRDDPTSALHDLATALGRPAPTQQQRALADGFVRGESGYRCPLPESCEIGGSGHDAGRMTSPPAVDGQAIRDRM